MVFFAGDLAAWLIGLLADRGRRKLVTVLLGTEQQRALRSVAMVAIQQTANELCPDDDGRAEHLALVISQVFGRVVPDAPLAKHQTVLEAVRAGIAVQLAVLDDPGMTGTGQSSAKELGVPVAVLADTLTACLLREIIIRGSGGEPLFPLATQLNADVTHLQIWRLEGVVNRRADELLDALGRLERADTPAVASAERRVGKAVEAIGRDKQAAAEVRQQAEEFGRRSENDRLDRLVFAVREPVSWPHRIGLPPELADGYQPRDVGAELDGLAVPGQTAVSTQVLTGMGGVGKTQLAAAYAHRAWTGRRVDLLLWITATDRPAIINEYARAAGDILGAPDGAAEQAAALFLTWLATTDRRWLIILDDLTRPGDLTRLWPPSTPSGTVLVTTRRRDAALADTRRRLIDVGLFTPREAVAYLRRKLRDAQPDQAALLAADLGYLPVALAQAAAYITDRGLDCAGYRQRLNDRKKTLLELVPEPDALPDDHRVTVDATWSLSVDRANKFLPVGVASIVLDLAALLDPNGIPTSLFTTTAALTHLTHSRTVRPGHPVDAQAVGDALHNLRRLNLVAIDTDRVRIHALVQRATCDQLTPDQLRTAAHADADAIIAIWPDPEPDPAFSQALRANATLLRQHTHDTLLTPNAHPVLFRPGRSLGDSGQVGAAAAHFGDLLRDVLRVLGPDHHDTLAARHSLAYWRGRAGDPAGAARASAELLVDQVRVLGTDHPNTLSTRRNLAHWHGQAGDATGAMAELQELLRDVLRVLGPDHPDTLATRYGVAWWTGYAGDPARAVVGFKELLPDRLRILGPDHPDTLATRHAIARWTGAAGSHADALAASAEVLVDRTRVLGPDHPDTLITRSNVAWWTGEAGDPTGAIAATSTLLADRLRLLGPDHPDTLLTRSNLAHWHGEAGDAVGAAAALSQLFADCLRILGPDHPHASTIRSELARWQEQAAARHVGGSQTENPPDGSAEASSKP